MAAPPFSERHDQAMRSADGSVCVIIAAWNAVHTVARAVASALAQPEVCEVVVIDDASGDDTALEALRACDGSGRLQVIGRLENFGPAAARNLAIGETAAPFLAIVDSDDFLMPGRFAKLLTFTEWDAIVDDIAFVTESRFADFKPDQVRSVSPEPEPLTFSTFVRGNISDRKKPRAELGFIKPLIRREFLNAHGLRYDESLRLGEDYELYSRMLALGARFTKIRSCGYVAAERADSLSGSHRTTDLAALLEADRRLLDLPDLSAGDRLALGAHIAHLAMKVHHRTILDEQRVYGRLRGFGAAAARPRLLPGLMASVWHDKFAGTAAPQLTNGVRYLFG